MDVDKHTQRTVTHVLREAPGRETALLVSGPERVIEKRFHGGDRLEAWFELFHGQLPRSPAQREYAALRTLHEAGLAVPSPISLASSGRRSSLRMEYVPHSQTLKDRLAEAGPAERRELGDRLLRMVLRLHGLGWYHRDLYLEHVLLREGTGELVLIDLGRARHGNPTRERWFEKDLAALAHSAPPEVGRPERLRFLCAYLTGRGVRDRSSRRRFAAATARRAARMGRHQPRHGVSHPLPSEARA